MDDQYRDRYDVNTVSWTTDEGANFTVTKGKCVRIRLLGVDFQYPRIKAIGVMNKDGLGVIPD